MDLFFCSIHTSKKSKHGLHFRPRFSITADLDSKHVLDSILSYFKCGHIYINKKKHTAEYNVTKLQDLLNIIIPHFINYPVFCAKLHAFELLNKIVIKLYDKNKTSIEDKREILNWALSMNLTTNRKKEKIEFFFNLLNCNSAEDREFLINNNHSVDINLCTDDFISGVIDGDGSFFISFQKDGKIKTGFNITNDKQSKSLLETIKLRFNEVG